MAQATHSHVGIAVGRRSAVSSLVDPRVLMVGLTASMGFGMMEMIIEAAVGQGFWSPVKDIAAVFTRGADTNPSFAAIPVLVGLMGHMMNAVMFGMIFAAMTRGIRNGVSLVMAGMAYAGAVFAVMWYGVLPAIDPAMKLVSTGGFLASHLMWGALLGGGIALVRSRRAASAQ